MMRSLVEVLAEVPDWRKVSGRRYELIGILTFVFLALLSGQNSIRQIAAWGRAPARGSTTRETAPLARAGSSRLAGFQVAADRRQGRRPMGPPGRCSTAHPAGDRLPARCHSTRARPAAGSWCKCRR